MFPTLNALARTIDHGVAHGISVEVVVVRDRADEATRVAVDGALESGILDPDRTSVLDTDFGDLSLARLAGIARCSAPVVGVLDADNLPSRTWITAALNVIRAHDDDVIVHPAAIVTFGAKRDVWMLAGSNDPRFRPGLLAWYNPWDAFCLAPREVFERYPYPATPPHSGFGPEDWAWNVLTVGAGVAHVIAPATALFYEAKHHGSLAAAHGSSLLPAHELLRSREVAAAELASIRENADRIARAQADAHAQAERARSSGGGSRRVVSMLRRGRRLLRPLSPQNPAIEASTPSANIIENRVPAWLVDEWAVGHRMQPALAFPSAETVATYATWGDRWDESFLPDREAYWSAVRDLPERIDALFVVPWLSSGGADLLAKQYIDAVRRMRPDASIVLITTEPRASGALGELASDVRVFDLGRFRLLQVFAVRVLGTIIAQWRPALVHVVNSTVGFDALDVHGRALSSHSRLFASTFVIDRHPDGSDWSFLFHRSPDFFSHIEAVLTDNEGIVDALALGQGAPRNKFLVHRQWVAAGPTTSSGDIDGGAVGSDGDVTRSEPAEIVWAGRFDAQKRLDRFAAVVTAANERGLGWNVSVFGEPVIGDDSTLSASLAALEAGGSTVHGPYRGVLGDVAPAGAVLVVTSDREGRPNTVLEAMAAGIAVVAPAIGELPDLLADGRGVLVAPDASADEVLAVVDQLVNDAGRRADITRSARSYVHRSYAREGFDQYVRDVPGYLPPVQRAESSPIVGAPRVRWYADRRTREVLASDERKVLVYTGSNGHSNFGDILQNKNMVAYWTARPDVVPVLFLPAFAASSPEREAALRRWSGADHVVYFGQEHEMRGALPEIAAIAPRSHLHVIGGGYLNSMWGESHFAAIEAIAVDFDVDDVLFSGLQIDDSAVPLFEHLSSRVTVAAVGLRDAESLSLARSTLSMPVVDTFDDISETLVAWVQPLLARRYAPTDDRAVVHLNVSDYAGGKDAVSRWRESLRDLADSGIRELVVVSSYSDEREDVRDSLRAVAALAEDFPFTIFTVVDLARVALDASVTEADLEALQLLRGARVALSSSYHTAMLLSLLEVPTYLVAANGYFAQKRGVFPEVSLREFLGSPEAHVTTWDARLRVRSEWLRHLAPWPTGPVVASSQDA